MKISQKRILSILAAAAMTCGTLPQSAPLPLLQPVLTASAEESVYEDFTYEENENGITITKYNGTDAEVEIPGEIDGKSVTVIGKHAFMQNTHMISVAIPDSVQTIGASAFNSCTGLTEIVFPQYLTTVESSAFAGCSGLTKVVMAGGVTSIGSGVFSSCTNLTEIDIPESVTDIGYGAFNYTAWLKQKQTENPLVVVNHILIDGTTCKGEVTVPEDVTSICGNAFYDCTKLTTIFIPRGVESIGDDAFNNCTGLMSIDFENPSSTDNRLKTIGSRAFFNCQKLKEIRIPDSVTDIGFSTFYSCTSLEYVHLPKKLTEIKPNPSRNSPGVFQGCSALETIEIPEGVSNIGQQAFALCSGLKDVKIYGINTTIGVYAFLSCSSDLTLYGYAGSPAQEYASQNPNTMDFKELNAAFSGVSLTLTDDLGLNFFAQGVTAANSENYHVVFSGKCEEAGQDIKFTEKDGKFCVTANVAAPNMGEFIEATLERHNGESWETVDTLTWSVNGYLASAKPEEGWSEEKTEAFNKLVDTVKLYGEVSNAYFKNPEHMPEVTDHKEELLDGDVIYNDYCKYDTATLEGDDSTKDSDLISLTLNSRLSMRLYLDGLTAGDTGEFHNINRYGIMTNSRTPVTAKTSRFGSYFEITDISPLRMGTVRIIYYNGFTYQFSPLTWCYRVKKSDYLKGNTKEQAMADILYEYYIDATAFSEAN